MKKIGALVLFIISFIFVWEGYRYFDFRTKNAVSNAAFVRSHFLSPLSFKTGGKIIALLKEEGENVKKGEIIAKIDAIDYILKKKELQEETKAISYKIESLKIKKEKIKKDLDLKILIAKNSFKEIINQKEALVYALDAQKEKLKKVSKDESRFKNLYNEKLIPKSKYEEIKTKKNFLSNIVAAKEKEVYAIQKRILNAKTEISLLKIVMLL